MAGKLADEIGKTITLTMSSIRRLPDRIKGSQANPVNQILE